MTCIVVATGVSACSGDGRELRPPPGFDDGRIVSIDLLSSPEPAVAELLGSGALESDPVTVDGRRVDVESFEAESAGRFRIRVRMAEGVHTVFVAAACGQVFTMAADAAGGSSSGG
ncbi:MAG: hypothetical protein ACO4CU_00145 [Ilumatobacteraceae bacterium]